MVAVVAGVVAAGVVAAGGGLAVVLSEDELPQAASNSATTASIAIEVQRPIVISRPWKSSGVGPLRAP